MGRYDGIVQRLTDWSQGCDQVHAAVIIGSQARSQTPADQYSDLDLVLVVSSVQPFLQQDQWLKAIGEPRIVFTENTFAGGKERRVLFEGALDVDFVLLTPDGFATVMAAPDCRAILGRGHRVLVDKIGLTQQLDGLELTLPPTPLPGQGEVDNLIQDFWFHTVWTAKKLARGELWTAHACLDGYLKRLLLQMMGWHAQAEHGKEYDTWHAGRFVEQWAGRDAVTRLPQVFARYDRADMVWALGQTMALFGDLARQACARLGYGYAQAAEEEARRWVALICPDPESEKSGGFVKKQ